MRHENAKNNELRDQQLPYVTNVSSSMTDNYCASVFIGYLIPWRHLTARRPCQEVGTTMIHGPLSLDQRHAKFTMCTSQKRPFSHCRPSGGSHLA